MKNHKFPSNTIIQLFALLISTVSYSQEYPDSSPNGGRIGGHDWSSSDYQENATKDSLEAVKSYHFDLAQAENIKPNTAPKEVKKKGWFAKNIIDVNEIQRSKNDKLKAQQYAYQQKVQAAKDDFDQKIKKIQKYRDDWVEYLKEEKIAKAKAKKEQEIEAEAKRIQDEKDAQIAQEKAEEERKLLEAEWKAMPTNPKYKQWKSKYEKSISLAEANVSKCEAIIKKHTFKNAFGEKIYDSSDFTSSEKEIFNKNIDLLRKLNDEIRELERENKYYSYWNANVSDYKLSSSYRLSSYSNSTGKVY